LEDGKYYEGEILPDHTIHGNGVLYSRDNQVIYHGSWREGVFHGFGTLNNIDAIQMEVNYMNLQ
jgi:hypothetical protein